MRLKKRGNPFYASFLGVVITCCIILSIIAFILGYMNEKRFIQKYATEKAEQVMEDWEVQLQQIKAVAVRIVSDYSFHPAFFQQSLSNELSMLADLPRYKDYSVLVEEYFFEYGAEKIYRSSGDSIAFELYLKMKSNSDEERQLFQQEIEALKKSLSGICGEPKVISAFGKLYVLIPIKLYAMEGTTNAVLGFSVLPGALKNRIKFVGSNMDGEITLYGETGVLYSNSEIPCEEGKHGVIAVASADGAYTLCYRPEMKGEMNSDLYLFLLLLILTDLVLILVLSKVFSQKAYAPVQLLAEKYRKKVADLDVCHENAIEEIRYMMDEILEKNTTANAQIQRNQKEIRSQLLQMALDSRTFSEMTPSMEKAGIYLPGPYYCVAGVSFVNVETVPADFLERLLAEIELISDEKEEEYIYAVCNVNKKLINIIISAPSEESKDSLLETICDVAVSFSYEPIIGIGNTYSSIRNLPTSYLESMDDILYKQRRVGDDQQKSKGFIYENDDLRYISAALEHGNERLALERVDDFVKKIWSGPVSMLMMQYIVADFLGEIRKLGTKYKIEISKTSTSPLVSARNAMDFRIAVEKIIHEFCEKQDSLRSQMKEEESAKIVEYIQKNFMQYDVSIDSIAESMQTSADAVRAAVQKHTGKLYRDYLIFLRIEYAKTLLLQEDISVAELCQKIGYGNVSYFIKLFRQTVGITPAQYRKNVAAFKDNDSGQQAESEMVNGENGGDE